MNNRRIEWIDSARGFAMLSVVVCHIANGFYRSQMYVQYGEALYSIQKICNSFQMPLFCIISGFLFGKVYISENGIVIKDKVKKQIINFALLYLIWSLLFGIIKVFMGGSVNDIVRPIDILLIPVNPIGVYWWLYVLIFIYIDIYFYFTCIYKKVNKHALLTILFVLYLISSMIIKEEWTQWLEIRRIVYYLFIFIVGIEYERITDRKKLWPIILISLIISLMLIALFWNREEEIYHIPILNAILALLLGVSILWMFENISYLNKSKLLQLMGAHSLEIYLIHVFITAGSRFFIFGLPPEGAIIYLIIILVITIIIPVGIGHISKKIGVYDYLFCPYRVITNKKTRREV